jgi:inosine-uridine nucleoside N-ribohydrolase
MKKIPVIIDCDPGVDDSYAIAMAHAHPEFDIVALTAVEGNVPAALTRRNCLCLREVLGMTDTKVAFGAELPLQKEYTRVVSVTHGAGGVGGIEFPDPERAPEDMPAWDLIYTEAVKHAGELVLFAVGPLTNIAIALRKYPDLPKYIKRFVIMGGGTFGNVSATDEKAEFNIWIDPTAAKEVFEKMEVWMVGLNATHAAALTEQDFDDLLAVTEGAAGRAGDFLHRLTAFSRENSYGRGDDNNVIHDALAVAALIDPATVTFEKRRVYVEDGRVRNEGETVISPAGTPGANCHVAMAVDQPRFVQLLKKTCAHYILLK